MFCLLSSVVPSARRCCFTEPTAKRRPSRRPHLRLALEFLERRDVPSITLTSPGDQFNYDGAAVNLAVSSSDSTGATMVFTATGLPPGTVIDAGTGTITGTLSTSAHSSGPYTPTIYVNDEADFASVTFNWTALNPVTVNNPGTQTNYVGTAVDLAVSGSDAAGGTLAFSPWNLPPGLTYNSGTGHITGTVGANADTNNPYTVGLYASDGTYSDSQSFSWVVQPYPVTLTRPGNQTQYVSNSVYVSLSAGNATGSMLTFGETGLPPGLSFDWGNGIITGTVSAGADTGSPYSVTLTASAGGYVASQTVSWTILPYPVTLTNPGDQSGYVGGAVDLTLSASDATGGYLSYYVNGLPDGLTVAGNRITGTVSIVANTNSATTVTILVSDGVYSASQSLSWMVHRYPVTLTSPGDQTNYVNDSVYVSLNAGDATGGTLTYGATGLPVGLGINPATGEICGGVVGSGGSYTVTVTTGNGTYSASQTFTWTVNAYPVVLSHVGTQYKNAGDSVSLQVSGTDSTNGTLTYSETGLPDGLSINPNTGLISGIISSTADSNSPFVIVVKADDGAFSDEKAFCLVVEEQPEQAVAILTVYQEVSNLNDAGAGSLRAAIVAANASNFSGAFCFFSITFANNLNGTVTLATALPNLGKNFNISGPTNGNVVTIARKDDAVTQFRIFTIAFDMSCDLSYLTITNGDAGNNPGGGILCNHGSTLNLYMMTVRGNKTAGDGGGIYNRGTLTVENCIIELNQAGRYGGGICNYGADAWVNDSIIGWNEAGWSGGGILNFGFASLTMTNVEVVRNYWFQP